MTLTDQAAEYADDRSDAALIERLRQALQEADTIMGHDDAAAEWRERWSGLWNAEAKPRAASA